MDRRWFLAAISSAGVATTVGCSVVGGSKTLSEPTVHTESSGRRSLSFTSKGTEIGSLGVTGTVTSEGIDLETELWHRRDTAVRSITLEFWMPPRGTDSGTAVAVVSPVEGDSSPPPSVSLSSPRHESGSIVEIDDLDDLADETINTLEFIVRPGSETATTLVIDGRIELASGAWFGSDYTLDGRLRLDFPALRNQ
ncbi:hypothetical protein [Natrinema sp. 74]|uniref:hypothetical protein n=1 Tax=Natrinema sp. 74 TaxID=3384159 RepID=UPI0038D4F740